MDDFLEHFKLQATVKDHQTIHQRDKRNREGIERWNRIRVVGQGAYGKVWLEQRMGSGEARAVKEVPKYIQMDHLKEIRAIAKFSKYKSSFAEFFGWYEDQFSYFLAMEYIQHGTLFDCLKDQDIPIPENQSKEIVGQLLDGLAYMHEHDYAHRDLKPGNIFIVSPAPRWWVKIGDFGISKRITEDTTLQTTKLYTKAYCAPEMRGFVRDRCETDNYAYTNAVDIWALGVITYEISTMQRPFPTRDSLIHFYDGRISFPGEELERASVTPKGIEFMTQLLKPRPHERPIAKMALESPWLEVYHTDERPRSSRDVISEQSDNIRTELNPLVSMHPRFSDEPRNVKESIKVHSTQEMHGPNKAEFATTYFRSPQNHEGDQKMRESTSGRFQTNFSTPYSGEWTPRADSHQNTEVSRYDKENQPNLSEREVINSTENVRRSLPQDQITRFAGDVNKVFQSANDSTTIDLYSVPSNASRTASTDPLMSTSKSLNENRRDQQKRSTHRKRLTRLFSRTKVQNRNVDRGEERDDSIVNVPSGDNARIPEVPAPVFEKSLIYLHERDGLLVPRVVMRAIKAIEMHGNGINRLYNSSTSATAVSALRALVNRNDFNVDLCLPSVFHSDIRVVVGLVKQFLRELPEPLLTDERYRQFIDGAALNDEEQRSASIRSTVVSLPLEHYTTLKVLMLHLKWAYKRDLAGEEPEDRLQSLAVTFAPFLMGFQWRKSKEIALQPRVVKTLVQHVGEIFGDNAG